MMNLRLNELSLFEARHSRSYGKCINMHQQLRANILAMECNYNFLEILKQQINRLDSGRRVFPGGAVVARNQITDVIVWGLWSQSEND